MKILNIELFLIAVLIGIELSLGILVAPEIFYPVVGKDVLSHFQSGQIMTQIFVKFGYILLFISIFMLICESLNLRSKENFNKKFSTFMLSFINFCLAIIFVFYFTRYVLDAQNLGAQATQTTEFLKIHNASEWDMKTMLFLQLFLFFIKFPKNAN